MNKGWVWALIAGIVVLFAIFYIFISNQPGIKFSCQDKKIIGFDTISGFGLMEIVPPPIVCQIEISITINEKVICESKIKSYNEEITYACKNLKNYENEVVLVSAVFYSADGTEKIEEDTKSVKVLSTSQPM